MLYQELESRRWGRHRGLILGIPPLLSTLWSDLLYRRSVSSWIEYIKILPRDGLGAMVLSQSI